MIQVGTHVHYILNCQGKWEKVTSQDDYRGKSCIVFLSFDTSEFQALSYSKKKRTKIQPINMEIYGRTERYIMQINDAENFHQRTWLDFKSSRFSIGRNYIKMSDLKLNVNATTINIINPRLEQFAD